MGHLMTVPVVPLTGTAYLPISTDTNPTPAVGEQVTVRPFRAMSTDDGTILVGLKAVVVGTLTQLQPGQ